jgi:hypothetical protein
MPTLDEFMQAMSGKPTSASRSREFDHHQAPQSNAISNALAEWMKGVKERTLHPLEAAAKASQEMVSKPAGEIAMDWSNPIPIGLAGIFAGAKAKTADMAKLALAQKLKQAGVADDVIHAKTGWFSGMADGKWRFEIPDNKASLNLKDAGYMGVKNSFDDIATALNHPKLKSAYPEFNRYEVNISHNPGGIESGKFNTGLMSGKPSITATGEDVTGVTLHELQHAIQEREGFARGGSPEMFKQAQGNIEGLHSYDDMAHAEQIINMAKQYGKSVDEFMKNPPRWVTDKQVAIAKNFENRSPKDLQYAKNYIIEKTDPNEAYNRLAGEAEARLTQARMKMTMPERLKSYPPSMFDVPVSDQIVRYGDDVAMSVPANYKGLLTAPMKDGMAGTIDKVGKGGAKQPMWTSLDSISKPAGTPWSPHNNYIDNPSYKTPIGAQDVGRPTRGVYDEIITMQKLDAAKRQADFQLKMQNAIDLDARRAAHHGNVQPAREVQGGINGEDWSVAKRQAEIDAARGWAR